MTNTIPEATLSPDSWRNMPLRDLIAALLESARDGGYLPRREIKDTWRPFVEMEAGLADGPELDTVDISAEDLALLVEYINAHPHPPLPVNEIPCGSSSACPVNHKDVPVNCSDCPFDPSGKPPGPVHNLFLLCTPRGHEVVSLRAGVRVTVATYHIRQAVANLLRVVSRNEVRLPPSYPFGSHKTRKTP